MEILANTMRRIRLHSIDSTEEIIAIVLMIAVYCILTFISKKLFQNSYRTLIQVIIVIITIVIGVAAMFLLDV